MGETMRRTMNPYEYSEEHISLKRDPKKAQSGCRSENTEQPTFLPLFDPRRPGAHTVGACHHTIHVRFGSGPGPI